MGLETCKNALKNQEQRLHSIQSSFGHVQTPTKNDHLHFGGFA
jgi:hypothetical protein